jgi:hypothetical protein
MSEHKYPALSSEYSEQCKHRIIGIVPMVAVRVEGGYTARCLLCGTSGPVRGNIEAARSVLLE